MSAQNIELSGNLFVSGSSTLSESLDVSGDVVVDGTLDVSGGAFFGDRLDVSGDVVVDGSLDISGGAFFGDRLDVSGDVVVDGSLDVSAGVFFGDRLDVSGDVVVDGTLDVSGDVFFGSDLDVSGDVAVDGNVGIGGGHSSEKLKVYGDVNITGNINVDGSFSFSEVVQNTTTINNTLLVSTQLDVSNEGTGPALKVSQLGDGDDQDVALFNAGDEGDALKIDSSGNTFVYKDVDISGHTTLKDVSCNGNIDICGGSVNVVGDKTNGDIMTIRNDNTIFDTIVIRRIVNGDNRWPGIVEIQLWKDNDNVMPDLVTPSTFNTDGTPLQDIPDIPFFIDWSDKTLDPYHIGEYPYYPSNVANEIIDEVGAYWGITPSSSNNNVNIALYVPLTSTLNTNDIQSLVIYGRVGNMFVGARVELYNRAIDPTLSTPVAYTNTIETAANVYRFDFPAISTYPSGSFVSADSTTHIVSESYAQYSTNFSSTRTGLKIENAGLEVGGSATIDGGLEVGGSATIAGTFRVSGNSTIGTRLGNDDININGDTHIHNFQSTNPSLIVQNGRLNGDCIVDFKNIARSQKLSQSGGWYRFRTDGGGSNGKFFIQQYNGKTSAFIRTALTISNNGTVSGNLSNTSDDRLKKDERFITNAIQTISKLRPQTYQKYDTMDCSGYYRFESGLIAQEIYYDAPELRHLVSVPDDADISGHILTSEDPSIDPDYSNWGTTPASVNYSGLTAYLIKAIQEQQDIINEEKEKNQTQYNELLARIQALES